MADINKAPNPDPTFSEQVKNKTGKVFDKIRLIFLDELSNLIIKNKSCKNYGDLIALSFWLKKKIYQNLN